MKKYLLLFFGLAMFTLLSAEDGTKRSVQEILMSKTWHLGKTADVGYRFVFTRDSIEFCVVGSYGYDNFRDKWVYYLSNTNDVEFDDAKVGKNQNGKYLIEKSSGKPNVRCLEILEISDNQIKFGTPNGTKGDLIYNAVK